MRWFIALVACGGLCGCSSSAYDAAAARRLAEYRSAAEFAVLHPAATPVADGQVEIRLPAAMVNQLDGGDAAGSARPPFIRDFPGFAAAYEGAGTAAEGRFPFVLTVGVVPAAERREAADSILRQVRKNGEFDAPAWQRGREVVDAWGATRKWDVLELKGPQAFRFTPNGAVAPEERRFPGTTEVWLSADPAAKAAVILAWRVPDAVAAGLPLPATSTLAARAVRLPAP